MGVDHNILTAYVGLHPSTSFPGSSLLLPQVVHPGNYINWPCLIISSRVAVGDCCISILLSINNYSED